MAIAQGIFKNLVAKKQTALGTKASASGAQYLRRVTSDIDLSKDTYQSNEILATQQVRDMRHGLKNVSGTISGENSIGGYQGFTESVLRSTASTAIASTPAIDVTAAVTTGAEGTFTTIGEDWLADGFKIGMVVQWTGWTTTGVLNNDQNFRIIALTATVMTVVAIGGSEVVTAKTAGDSVTCTSVGKHISVPTTGHNQDYWTIEHDYSDITQAEQFVDCAIGSMNVALPPTGMSTVDFGVVGLSMDTSTSAYFTTPTATATGAILAGVNGSVYVNGSSIGLITGFDFAVDGAVASLGAVVGSNQAPDVQFGRVTVTGNMTVFFQDAVMRDLFINETEVSVVATFVADNTAASESVTYIMTRVKLGGATKDDGEKGLILTVPFTALEDTAGGTGLDTIQTTITVQDSSFV